MGNLAIRLANILGKPFGINPFPRAFANPTVTSTERSSAFDEVFTKAGWGSAESASGPGSEQARTRAYRTRLIKLIRRLDIAVLLDAPCGDLNWIGPVTRKARYIGADVSPALIAALKQRHDLDLRVLDICSDPLPTADLWHCRDCLMHLPLEQGLDALRNFARSDIPYALLTTHRSRWGHRNLDIPVGGWRYLDLEKAPFGLPPPDESLADYRFGRDFPRFVGLWRRETIAHSLSA